MLASCLEGVCGTCETEVIDGDVDHRDSVLNEEEQAANEYMMICVSRCKSPGSPGPLDLTDRTAGYRTLERTMSRSLRPAAGAAVPTTPATAGTCRHQRRGRSASRWADAPSGPRSCCTAPRRARLSRWRTVRTPALPAQPRPGRRGHDRLRLLRLRLRRPRRLRPRADAGEIPVGARVRAFPVHERTAFSCGPGSVSPRWRRAAPPPSRPGSPTPAGRPSAMNGRPRPTSCCCTRTSPTSPMSRSWTPTSRHPCCAAQPPPLEVEVTETTVSFAATTRLRRSPVACRTSRPAGRCRARPA